MELDNYHQDEPFVNIISTSPPSNSSLNDESNNSNPGRTMPRPAGGALRSRRNPPTIVLSTSPSTTINPSADHMHMIVSQPSAPSVPVEMAPQEAPSNSVPIPPAAAPPAPTSCSSSLTGGKSKLHTAKEIEAQYSKSQDTGQSIDASDFECSLCIRVFYQPVTTPCGHVFCKQCLFSSLKYSAHCPLCRHKLETSPVQHKYAVNVVLMNMIEKYFPKEHKERLEEDIQYQETHATNDKELQAQGAEEESSRPQSPSWSCIIPSLRSTCNVILSCGGF
jgi:hypothetical protein